MVKVSVIIPIYNVEKYVEQCIRSVMDQTFRELEIICVDDGSTDSSGLIADKCSKEDPRIKVIHKKNTGYGNTLNCGFQAASGEYIGIVESDDFAEPDMYRKLYIAAKENNLDYVRTEYYEYFDSGKRLHEVYSACDYETIFSEYENMNKIFLTKSIWSGIYRREFLLKKNIWLLETAGASYQDTSFWFKVCITAKRGMLLKEPLINYRIDNGNSSVKSVEKVFCICEEIEECQRYLEQSDLNQNILQPFLCKYMYNCYQWNMRRIDERYLKDFISYTSPMIERMANNMQPGENGAVAETIRLDMALWAKMPELYYTKMLERRITGCNSFVYEDFFRQYFSENNMYIYGAGKVGRRLGEIIQKINPDCRVQFLVSDRDESADVLLIQEESLCRDRKVIIAVADAEMKLEMRRNAIRNGFRKIFVWDDMMNYVLSDMVNARHG